MSLREALQRILTEYEVARREPLEGHALAAFIRRGAKQAVEDTLGEFGAGLVVEGSPGQGNWAAVPWISVFDPAVTTSATRGYYVVYLFNPSASAVYLSLNQGTTAVREEFRSRARDVLRDRADFMRKRAADFEPLLPIRSIDLGSAARLPGDYVVGHALGVSYTLAALPDEDRLRSDLQAAVRAYRALTFRGGLESDASPLSDVAAEFELPSSATVAETRRYALHMKIERNPTAAKLAKRYHGTTCQVCGLNFEDRYGPIGAGFIEAHHLKPISSLEEGVSVPYDVVEDFAVLCSNCHRMIHRTGDPGDLAGIRMLLRSREG